MELRGWEIGISENMEVEELSNSTWFGWSPTLHGWRGAQALYMEGGELKTSIWMEESSKTSHDDGGA